MQWNVTDAAYVDEFDVSGKELTPQGVFFKPDGTKMYTIGNTGNSVDEYDLGTQWDVTTAVYLQEFSVGVREGEAHGLFFKPDGTKMYTVGLGGDTVDEYDLGTQWDVSSAVYRAEFDVSGKELTSTGVCFKLDGTKMYTIGTTGITVDEYDLGIQWDVTSAVYLQEFSVILKEGSPIGVAFKPDGTKMYTIGTTGVTVDEYDLGTPWDVSTAVYLREFSVAAKETSPSGLFLKPDGTKMYTVGINGVTVDEYDL